MNMAIGSRSTICVLALAAAVGLSSCARKQEASVQLQMSPAVFDLGDGKFEFAERGYLFVPENRSKPESATIGVHFMRFRSTAAQPGTAIFMMAGGPGSSLIPALTEGTAGLGKPAEGNFKVALQMLEDLRSAADVVVIDQRGAGLSIPQMDCPNLQRVAPFDELFSESKYTESYQQYVRDCKQAWAQQGRDIDGYHALQLADDVDDLRRALGYQKISLWGGSFGSEWGLVTLRRHPEIIERVVWRGLEGIQHTYDSPTGIMTSVEAILAQAQLDPDIAARVPKEGFVAAVRRRIEELGAAPVTVAATDPVTGAPVQVVIGADELRLAWRSPVTRRGPQAWPGTLLAILDGDLSEVAKSTLKSKGYFITSPVGNHMAMHMAIDCGLSPTPERRKELASDPAVELIGNINLPYFSFCDAWQAPNIQAEWLQPLRSDIPALFVHGTWDLSTPLQNAKEVAAGFSKGHLLVVEGGTHDVIGDLYREQPDTIRPLVRRFFAGQPIDDAPDQVSLPAVDFTAPPAKPAGRDKASGARQST
ncbi:MAG TPA: alpha/beta hydrolase [Steroidobacteraceae bacterium]|nr:alpha/beta hydrolase [Steroidobacteraceae bacterium]